MNWKQTDITTGKQKFCSITKIKAYTILGRIDICGLAANPDAALAKARSWLESDHEYTVRFAIGVLMELFLDERFRLEFFAWVIGVSRPEYYVNMMRAWYFAEALAKQPAAAEAVIASGALDEWTHNKAIQKAVESRRISPEQKDRLRAMKRRS